MAKRSGELIFKEGRTRVKDLFKTIATELTTEEWAILNRTSDPEVPWTFDINRTIKIPAITKKDMVQLYRILAKVNYKPTSTPFGEINVLQGNTSGNTAYLIIQVNDETISVPVPASSSTAATATIIANAIKTNMTGLADTIVSVSNDSLVLVKGETTVRNLSLNTDNTNSGIIAQSELVVLPTVGRIIPLGRGTSGSVTFTVNSEDFSITVAAGDTRATLANKIISSVAATLTGYTAKIVDLNDQIVEIAHETDDIVQLTSTAFTTSPLITSTEVQSSIAFITFKTETILSDTSMTLTLEGTQFNAVNIVAKETIPSIASKLNAIISSAGYTAEAVIGEPKIRIIRTNGTITTAQCSTDQVVSAPALFNGTANVSTRTVGKVKILGNSVYNDAAYVLTINGKNYNIQILAGFDNPRILQTILSAVITDYPQSYILNSEVYIVPSSGNVTSFTSTMPELILNSINTGSFTKEPTEYSGVIEILQSAGAAFDMVVRVNYVNHTIPIPLDTTADGIATAVQTYFAALPDYADTTVANNIVEIKGTASITQLSVDFVQIDDTYYDVQGDLIIGLGEGDNGTKIGDNVIIKTREVGQLFDYITFAPKEINGTVRYIADLISRPKGKISVFETTTETYLKERAMKRNPGEPIFSVNGTNLSKASTGANAIKVYKGADAATATLIARELYQVDFDNGLIMFGATPLEEGEFLFVDYTVITDQILNEVDSSKYQIMDNKIVALDPTLNELNGILFVNYKWELVYPASLLSFVPDQDRMVMKTYVDISQVQNKSLFKEYYIEFKKPTIKAEQITGVDVRYGTAITTTNEPELVFDKSSAWSRLAWYKADSATKLNLNDEMSISYFMNFTNEYLNLFVQGSAAFDSDYTNYIIAPLMWGMLEKYEGAIYTEDTYNCYFTVGSDKFGIPNLKWGENTGTGITDIVVDSTLSNVPYQAHYPSFHTVPEFMNKHYVNVSTETAAEQVGEIIIYHPVEKARGKIQGILTGDRSTIEHLGILIENKDRYDVSGALLDSENKIYNNCGGPNQSNQRTYVQLNINAPYSLFNNSPNVFYGVCMRKE